MKSIRYILAVALCAGMVSAASQWFDSDTAAGCGPASGTTTGGLTWADAPAGNAMWANTSAGTNVPVLWVSSNDAYFTAAGTATVTVNSATAGLLNFSAGTWYFLPGTGPLTLTNGMLVSIGTVTLGNDTTLANDQIWNLSGSLLTVTGKVIGASTGHQLTLTSNGKTFAFSNNLVNISRLNAAGNITSGGNGTVRNGNSAVTLPFGDGNIVADNSTLALLPVSGPAAYIGVTNLGSTFTFNTNVTFQMTTAAVSTLTYTIGTNGAAANSVVMRGGYGTMVLSNSTATALGGSERFIVNGGIANNNGMVGPYIVGRAAGGAYNFLAYDPVQGLTNVIYDLTNATTGGSAATKLAYTNAATTLAGSVAGCAVRVTGASVNLGGNTLTLGDGSNPVGLSLSATTVSNGTIALNGNTELVVPVNGTAILNTPITGVNLLNKFGAGTLVVSNAGYSGNVLVQSGTVSLNPTANYTGYLNNLSGYGTVSKDGPNTITLTGTTVVAANLTLNSGTICATNNGNAILNIGPSSGIGTLTFNGGNLTVDQLFMTNNIAPAANSLVAIGSSAGVVNILNGFTINALQTSGNGTPFSMVGTWNILGGQSFFSNYCSHASILDVGLQAWSGGGQLVVSGSQTVLTIAGAEGGTPAETMNVMGAGLIVSNNAKMNILATGYGVAVNDSSTILVNHGTLVAANGTYFYIGKKFNNGAGQNNASVIVTNGGCAVMSNVLIGRGPATNDVLIVMANGVVTNYSVAIGDTWAGAYLCKNNRMSISASGAVYTTGGSIIGGTTQTGANIGNSLSNNVVISGVGSVWSNSSDLTVGYVNNVNLAANGNWLTVSNGGSAFVANLTVSSVGPGYAGAIATGNTVTVNGGYLYVTNKVQVGAGTNFSQGTLTVLNGGLLEASSLSNGVTAGNYITNSTGIYQFSKAAPSIIPNGAGNIALNNGWVSFRGVTNVDVLGNWRGTLTNMTFSGVNTFRLNAATNSATIDQTYVFDPGLGTTNYAGLEMVNTGTCYRGLAGSSLTIGTNVGSAATMLCSNTAAIVSVPFTNNGTLTLFNSTLTFTTNATFNGTLQLDTGHLASLNGTVLASNLTLGANSSLIVTGAGTNAILATFTTVSGGFGSITAPAGYGISIANGRVRLLKSIGTSIFFR